VLHPRRTTRRCPQQHRAPAGGFTSISPSWPAPSRRSPDP